tara:strand:- start:400 stop:552 length:153 start_codon:yes stop_codon:yes gene_type:complete
MKDVDKAIVILKELLYGNRENLSPFGIDEELSYAISYLKAYKEKHANEKR